jgi:hypothetical protein
MHNVSRGRGEDVGFQSPENTTLQSRAYQPHAEIKKAGRTSTSSGPFGLRLANSLTILTRWGIGLDWESRLMKTDYSGIPKNRV